MIRATLYAAAFLLCVVYALHWHAQRMVRRQKLAVVEDKTEERQAS